ncbi:ATP-dependent DNA ligase [Streptomyces sp. HP-A2021]|uniref:ATP-dependent DNA ligase n=1 Tax=Streptomyces sp. HP-A2021 TaxID=2927875 RepID=UPI001FAFCA01|nr:ATP-dependent DNA ligase [Streptomyces sp. HP-A2021]UOB07642.1 ATP-dependent DNA ligase [Streptomyces sp. HP-A2021]
MWVHPQTAQESANPCASAFDLLRLSGTDTTSWPYRRRRTALESVFAARLLSAPWVLCPSTTDPDTVREWLTWASVGMEGVLFKRLDSVYEPAVRGWRKYKVRETAEAIVGAITDPVAAPSGLLLGRFNDDGRLQYTGRTTTLARAASSTVAGLLAPARRGHPWTGWSFSAGWGSRETLNVTLVEPELVVEVGVDVARDASGRWRHPARLHRARPDLSPANVPRGWRRQEEEPHTALTSRGRAACGAGGSRGRPHGRGAWSPRPWRLGGRSQRLRAGDFPSRTRAQS